MEKSFKIIVFSLFLLFAVCMVAAITSCYGENENEYYLIYSAGEGGYIEGNVKQTVKRGDDGRTVKAVADEYYRFVKWSDGVETSERRDKNLQSDITATAIFEKCVFKVTHIISRDKKTGGWLLFNSERVEVKWTDDFYWLEQYVNYGEDAAEITARPFLYVNRRVLWSDGEENATRQERNVTSDITVTAEVKVKVTYQVADGVGGRITGNLKQYVNAGETTQAVTAVPDSGYVFCGWSDLTNDTTHSVENAKESFDYFAYFEPIEKTFKYDYGIASGLPLSSDVTLNRNYLGCAKFVKPELAGYTFCGWYIDKEYTVKAVHENGQYMLGKRAFSLETETLYAKWRAKDEAEFEPTYKIMIVAVEEFKATLLSSKTQTEIEVDYKMTTPERELLSVLSDKVREYLNLWFDGKVKFEVDTYFTCDTVGEDSVDSGNAAGFIDYFVNANFIPETGELNKLYHSVLTAFGMNDYEHLLHNSAGLAWVKYGAVNIEGLVFGQVIEQLIEEIRNCDYNDDHTQNMRIYNAKTIIGTFIHEFVHTCETTYGNELVEFHKVIYHDGDYHSIEYSKLYLLGEAIYNGEKCGIPEEYWLHKKDVDINYVPVSVDGYPAGQVELIENTLEWSLYYENRPYVAGNIAYGADITVKAVPKEGYKFVRWSDGVTTAIRTDYNTISFMNVKAIFAKI